MVATAHKHAAERSYLKCEVTCEGRSREDPMPKGQRPRGDTPRPRPGAVAESARLRRRGNGREELPKSEVRGGGREVLPKTKVRGGGWEELPHASTPEARGGGREDQPHVQ